MRRLLYIIVFLLVSGSGGGLYAQRVDSLFTLPDSAQVFTLGELYDHLMLNHPMVKQANLLSDLAKQELRMARGNFDPKLEAQYAQKKFEGTNYYSVFNGALKFPSVIPIDPSIGVERNEGKYLDSERYISDEFGYKQFYVGVSVPLGRGLITDERRAALRQAALFGDMMEAEQVKVINKVLLEAAKEYWQWAYAYYNFRLFEQNVKIAQEIYRRVKVNHQLGEAAVIDTVQAQITWQQRTIERQEAYVSFINSGLRLSNFLWDSLGNPLQIKPNAAPMLDALITGISQDELARLIEYARQNHPELQKLSVKYQQYDVERRLAREFLKPRLNLNYYFLNQPFDPAWNTGFTLNDNYKLGVDFSFPLFLRKERAKLAQAKLKMSSTKFERSFEQQRILTELNTTYNELINTQQIIRQQGAMVENYYKLLDAELLNLENGESDLFKINIQQEKLIQSQSKLIKQLSEFEKSRATLYWAAGSSLVKE